MKLARIGKLSPIEPALSALRCPSCGSREFRFACSACGHERFTVGEELKLALDILYQKFFVSWVLFARTFSRAWSDPSGLLRGYREQGTAYLDQERLLRPAPYFVSSIGILVLLYSLFGADSASSLAGSAGYFVLFVVTSLCFAGLLHRVSRALGGAGGFSDTFAAVVYGHGFQLSVVPLLANLALLASPGKAMKGEMALLGNVLLVLANLVFLAWTAVRTVPWSISEVHRFGLCRGYLAVAAVGIAFYLVGSALSPLLNLALLPG